MPAINSAPAIASDEYRQAMRLVPAAVAVITAIHDGMRNGLTATAIASVTAEPPRLLILVNRRASAERLIAGSGRFAVNFLTPEQKDIAQRFSQPKLDEAARFGGAAWGTLESGSPVLAGALAALDCVVVHRDTFSTHTMFIGEVVATATGSGAPLVYHTGRYCRITEDVAV